MSAHWTTLLPFPAAEHDPATGTVVCNKAAHPLRPELDVLLRTAPLGPVRWAHRGRRWTGHRFDAPDGRTGLLLLDGTEAAADLHGLEHQLEETRAELLHEREARRDAEVRARAAAKAKATFLANMSHELRTPLNAILGYTEMLREEAGQGLQEDLDRVHGAAKRLETQINEVLELARIEAGTLQITRSNVYVGALLDELLGETHRKLMDKRLGLRCQLAARPILTTDGDRVRQIVSTLLENAVKFTEHGHIGLTTSIQDDRLEISVQDTGVGIEPAHQARIFEAFEQGDGSAGRGHEGAGAGLALCLQLAKLLGGDLTVDSEPGVGSRFTLSLPL